MVAVGVLVFLPCLASCQVVYLQPKGTTQGLWCQLTEGSVEVTVTQ